MELCPLHARLFEANKLKRMENIYQIEWPYDIAALISLMTLNLQ
jgi:hypothetical protein